MTAGEKAEKGIRILEIIDGNVRHALRLKEYFCRAAYRDEVKTHFNQSKAASGYNQAIDALYFELIMTLVRLYDDLPDQKHAENTASIPELIGLLSQTEVVAELQARSEQRKTPKDQLEKELESSNKDFLEKLKADARRSAQAETSEIFGLLNEFKKLKGSHLLGRLRSVRNELFAHTAIERTRNNPARYGDAEEFLKQTMQFVSLLNSAVRNVLCTYQEHIQLCVEQADFFWQAVVQKGEEKPT